MNKTATVRPQSANVNRIGRKVLNSYGQLNRENILKSFPESTLTQAWNSLCQFVAQNYYSGKGTMIKGFGTFTFSNADVSLEGTTNQYARDHRKRTPVFIVSKEFNENLRPGQYNPTGGVIYYNQKLNNSVSHVKFNYAELAYALNITKDECVMILQNEILYMSEAIRRGEFKNKEMPGIGTIMLRGNVLAVKFNNQLVESAKNVPQKLLQYKKNIHMYMEPEENKKIAIKDLPDVAKTMRALRPKTAVVTKISQGGEKWLKENLGVDLDELENENENNNDNTLTNFREAKEDYGTESVPQPDEQVSQSGTLNFINDKPKIVKKKQKQLTLRDLNIPTKVLEAILFHKSFIISEMKNFDKRNGGSILKIDCVRAFAKANVHYMLNSTLINDIIKVYTQGLESVDYMKLMTALLRDIKSIIGVQTRRPSSAKKTNTMLQMSRIAPQEQAKTDDVNIAKQTISLNDIKNEAISIKIMLPEMVYKNRTRLDQTMSIDELVKMLRSFNIAYPKTKIEQILSFIEIDDHQCFSLNEFNTKLNACKILANEICYEDTITILKKLKDIIYASGGENFLFQNGGNSITKKEFINKFANTKFSPSAIESVYHFMTKSSRNFTKADYNKFFTCKKDLDSEFDEAALKRINAAVRRAQLKPSEYFSHLLSYNINRNDNSITRYDFHRCCLAEKLSFSAEEIDHVFDLIDKKKDGVIDREEFLSAVTFESRALFRVQDVIKRNALDIEDIAFRLEIDMNKNEILDYIGFKLKIKKLDYTYSDNFIKSLFDEISNGESYVDTQSLIGAFDVFKKHNFIQTNNFSFKKNFIENIKQNATLQRLKQAFEHIDSNNGGRLTKADFCSIIQKFSNEFKDEDIMKFTRITKLVDSNNLVKYPEFINMIYYNAEDDQFTQCVEELKKYIDTQCDRKLIKFFQKLNRCENRSIYDTKTTITISQLTQFFGDKIRNLDANVVCKFDLDSDGLISIHDIQGIFERYVSTSFFKYENAMSTPETNLYASEQMSEERFKSIVKDIKKKMKAKNITEIGLFKKLDINGDGFVSNYEFNQRIDDIILLSPAIKDQFFNYLDYYKNGLVDLETFLKRFKEFKSNEILVKNNNKIECEIIDAFMQWAKEKSATYSDTEMFALIDSDCDGIINLNDFKKFCIDQLRIAKCDISEYKLQRVMQALSITKNKNIGMADFKEFVNKATSERDFIDFKEKFKETINQNLAPNKENTEWTNDVIEKFGMFISERFEDVEDFFEKNITKNSGKFTLEDFERFHRQYYECFDGFNLTRDEILAVFTTLDSQKKNFLTLRDFENKLKMFDFYKKMHFDIKNFIQQNFNNAVDAFKFFSTSENRNRDRIEETKSYSYINLTKKDFFDTMQKFFPNKYLTETILKYMTKYFKSPQSIPFSEFNFIYFDGVAYDDEFISKSKTKSKLAASRGRPRSATAGRKLDPKLQTPYDFDALTKLKRLIDSSKFDYSSFFSMYKSISDNGVINRFEFRNMIKKLDIGLTHLEIEEITSKIGMNREGKIDLNAFIKYITSDDKTVTSSHKNMTAFISDMKDLIYKYYSTPLLAFQFNDVNKSNDLDFSEFKAMICELYSKESRPQPNFALMKNAFDFLDLRKDGVIDLNEWNRAFTEYPGKLDVSASKSKMRTLREWEGSTDLQRIYCEIVKNRKLIKEYVKPFYINDGRGKLLVQCDNLISVLKQVLPRTKMSVTQWKMMVLIGDKERSGMVDFDLFMKIVESSAKQTIGQPKFKK